MRRFILVGAAGYIAPRHMEAIKKNDGELIAICDKSDSVGVIDRYFPNAEYFNNFTKMVNNTAADYLVICSPNYCHYQHALVGIYAGMDVICEKPTVISYELFKSLKSESEKTGKNVYSILQMRLHPIIDELQREIKPTGNTVEINYYTPRGDWYIKSWKGQEDCSGGILFNIGIHIIDLILYLFGPVNKFIRTSITEDQCSFIIDSEKAVIKLNLSTNKNLNKCRELNLNQVGHYEFTNYFENLHNESYNAILSGNGYTLADVEPAINLADLMRESV